MSLTEKLMQGAVETLTHTQPETPCEMYRWDVIDAARHYKQAGFKAICVKNHFGDSASWAYLANKHVDGIITLGGVCFEHSTGGFNVPLLRFLSKLNDSDPYACKVVWMPERDAVHHARVMQKLGHKESFANTLGITNVLEQEKVGLSPFVEGNVQKGLREDVIEILKIMGKYDMVLGMTHISPEEFIALMDQAKKFGVSKFVVTHASSAANASLQDSKRTPRGASTVEMKKELVAHGAMIEEAYVETQPLMQLFYYPTTDPMKDMWPHFREVGIDNICLTSGSGYTLDVDPVEQFRTHISILLRLGFVEDELQKMCSGNASRLFGLPSS